MTSIPWTLLLQSAAIINGLLLALVLAVNPRFHGTRARYRLALLLGCFSLALALFTAMDMQWLAVSPTLVIAEYTLALLSGALLVDFVAAACGRSGALRLPYLLVPAYLLLAPLLGGALLGNEGLALTVALQLALTLTATAIFLRSGERLVRRPRHVAWMLSGFWAFHAVQLARFAFPEIRWLYDAVPLLAAVLMLGLTVLVATDSRSLRTLLREAQPRDEADTALLWIDGYMQREKPFLDPALDLDTLARAVGLNGRRLSSVLAEGGAGFYEFVHRHRVEEACRLLSDPAEGRTSIEAISLMVGFRSRSTFYEAFRRQVGMAPAEYRASRND